MTVKGFHGTRAYVTDPDLEASVNCAIALEKPLLVRGEPGTGKTELATAISEHLGAPLIRWHVKSTSEAADGLYHYDAVQRLYDSRFSEGAVQDIEKYIRLGPIGEAFTSAQRSVLLIDEIDKADIEFPNDLLNELDRMSFVIRETNREVTAENRPVVVLTSNNEKELPDPFLRRCVFHFIRFPTVEQMSHILSLHHPDIDEQLKKSCIDRFFELRKVHGLRKKPSTSELIDWLSVLVATGVTTLEDGLPFPGVLLKREEDLLRLATKT